MTVTEILSPLEHDEEEEIMKCLTHGEWEEMFFLCGKYGVSLQDAEKLKYYG